MIYLDNAATTRMSKNVYASMIPYLTSEFSNPSGLYEFSEKPANALEYVREKIANLINATKNEIFFTSGGTEGDNWIIKSSAFKYLINNGKPGHIIVSAIEHHAVIETAEFLRSLGFEISIAPVDRDGLIKNDVLAGLIRKDTCLISIMIVNNEIGTIQDIYKINKIIRNKEKELGNTIVFHTDAVAAFGHIRIDVKELGVDALSVSGHKFHAPKGVGFIYYKNGDLNPYFHGGNQEMNHRAGTENIASIVGMCTAAVDSYDNLNEKYMRITAMKDYIIRRVLYEIPGSKLNGHRIKRVNSNMNFMIEGVSGAMLVILLGKDGICVSSGSACTSRSGKASHVLRAIGLSETDANSSIRVTIDEDLTYEEADLFVEKLKEKVNLLKELDK